MKHLILVGVFFIAIVSLMMMASNQDIDNQESYQNGKEKDEMLKPRGGWGGM